MPDRELATMCDACQAPLYYDETATMRYTGEILDGTRVVKFPCFACAEALAD